MVAGITNSANNKNNTNTQQLASNMPYYLRRHRETSQPIQAAKSSKIIKPMASSLYSSSQSNSPSPSPLSSGSEQLLNMLDNNNNTKHKQNKSHMIQLCFDSVSVKTGATTSTRMTTRTNTKLPVPVNKSNSKLSKVDSAKKKSKLEDDEAEEYDNEGEEEEDENDTLKLSSKLLSSDDGEDLVEASKKSTIGKNRVVSFAKTEPSGKKSSRTPPHKKFRKLRLFDTPHTPKTLIKKSRLASASDSNPASAPTNQIEAKSSTSKTLTSRSSSSSSNSSTVTKCTTVTQSTTKYVHYSSSSNETELSPPHNQLFKSSKSIFSDIFDNVSQTPKSLRRTPHLKSSLRDEAEYMDVELVQRTSAKQQQQQPNLRMRLFDQTEAEPRNQANKILNFDDTDNEDEASKLSATKQAWSTSKPNDYDDEMRQLFEQPVGMIQPPPTPVLSRSSAPLSSSNSSLFKPIRNGSSSVGAANVFTNHFQVQNQRSGTVSYTCSNSCPNNSSHNSTCTFSNIRSPHSPFQFNQLQANINPFTPTFDNSKLTSASNAANMVKLAVANLNSTSSTPGIRKQTTVDCTASLTRTKTQLVSSLSSSLQQLPTTSTSTKRCYEIELNVNSTNPNESLNQSANNNNEDENLNSSLNNKNADEHSNSLPRNKRLALRQCLVSRYHEEFHEVCKLGSGEFGDVFKCINRLDGCTYAIKRSKKPIAGSALEVAAWKEVCAHAVLVKHNHIVQYYSAWAEADRMLIQNEYCNGGSLAEFIESLKMNNGEMQESTSPNSSNQLMMNEADLKILLLHIAKGLAYMHSLNLVHLDIKPGNIFICRSPRRHVNLDAVSDGLVKGRGINEESGIDSDDMDEGEEAVMPATGAASSLAGAKSTASLFSEVITYKIGDLGHVTSTLEPHVEEGDCRYLPNEILQEQYDQLPKADVFALALTVFVCGSLEELPKNGDEWHWIRRGNLKDLGQCSERFRKLLLQMIHENPVQRPSANTLIHHPCICPDATKSKAQLRKELNQEKFKNEMLQRKVKKYEEQMNQIDSPTASKLNTNKSEDASKHASSKFVRSYSSSTIL